MSLCDQLRCFPRGHPTVYGDFFLRWLAQLFRLRCLGSSSLMAWLRSFYISGKRPGLVRQQRFVSTKKANGGAATTAAVHWCHAGAAAAAVLSRHGGATASHGPVLPWRTVDGKEKTPLLLGRTRSNACITDKNLLTGQNSSFL
jgi:hypothetical protein